MALQDLTPGDEASQSIVVAPAHFASVIVPGTPDAFSTASLCALVEKTAADWMAPHLDEGQMTVGAQIVIDHTAATPEGMTITGTVTLAGVGGRRFDFTWVAHDGVEQCGSGTHRRFVVDSERFQQRLAGKITQ